MTLLIPPSRHPTKVACGIRQYPFVEGVRHDKIGGSCLSYHPTPQLLIETSEASTKHEIHRDFLHNVTGGSSLISLGIHQSVRGYKVGTNTSLYSWSLHYHESASQIYLQIMQFSLLHQEEVAGPSESHLRMSLPLPMAHGSGGAKSTNKEEHAMEALGLRHGNNSRQQPQPAATLLLT